MRIYEYVNTKTMRREMRICEFEEEIDEIEYEEEEEPPSSSSSETITHSLIKAVFFIV